MTKTPPTYLTKEVLCFYSIRSDSVRIDDKLHRRLPDGTLDVVVNLGAAVSICSNSNSYEVMPMVAVTGLYTERTLLQYGNSIHLVGAVLQPGFAHLFMRDTLEGFQTATCDARDVLGDGVHALRERLQLNSSEHEKHRLLERFLLARMKQSNVIDRNTKIQNALAVIQDRKGAMNIGDLSKQFHMSERNFRRNFLEYVGMSPKKYAAIIRTKAFCTMYRQGRRYADCVDELSFTDTPHLFKDFKRIVGVAPPEYFPKINAIAEAYMSLV